MKTTLVAVGLALSFFAATLGSLLEGEATPSELMPLNTKLDHFEVSDGILRDGISALSLEHIQGLHLGFEELIRDRIQDNPRAQGNHFSVRLDNVTVKEVLDRLCTLDDRYTWSQDGATINVYPLLTVDNPSYLFNLFIQKIGVKNIPDPDQALTPLSRLLPQQQIGYFGAGLGSNAYAKPWTTTFEHLTVRQYVNRLSEHMGGETSWVWQGGKGERMFTFVKDGFHTR